MSPSCCAAGEQQHLVDCEQMAVLSVQASCPRTHPVHFADLIPSPDRLIPHRSPNFMESSGSLAEPVISGQQVTAGDQRAGKQRGQTSPTAKRSIPSGDGAVLRKGTTATQRLKQDYMRILKDPVPYVTAHPLPANILEWHYVVRGPEGTAYEAGLYQGKLIFPSEFPFKPPTIYMLTPNGRFKTNVRLCLSISDYHPDTWNPAWSVSTILTGLLSFMIENNPTMGSIETSDYEKKVLAKQSLDFNLGNKAFVELFPDLVNEIRDRKKKLAAGEKKTSVSGRVTELGNTIRSHGLRAGQANNNQKEAGFLSSLISTTFVVVVFVAFLYTVRYVLQTISSQPSGSVP